MAEQYISIKQFVGKINKHPLLRELSFSNIVDYTVDFMRIVGVPNMFIEKVAIIPIEEWRGALPCDYYQVNQIKYKDRPLRYATDSFHLSSIDNHNLTYKIQNGIIITSFKEGEIEFSYQAIPVDDMGLPLLPDNSSFTRALEAYIKKQWFTILMDMGKIQPQIVQNAKQEYAWAVGDCQTEFNRLSIDKAESFFNSWRTLLLRDNEHSYGFKNNGNKQNLSID